MPKVPHAKNEKITNRWISLNFLTSLENVCSVDEEGKLIVNLVYSFLLFDIRKNLHNATKALHQFLVVFFS